MSEMKSKKHNCIMIDSNDNVVISIFALNDGDEVIYNSPEGAQCNLNTIMDIPQFHKIAICDIVKGERVIKYGEFIGVATEDIKCGQHVSIHNCQSSDELKHEAEGFNNANNSINTDKDTPNDNTEKTYAPNIIKSHCPDFFNGYKREDGGIGIRNHVLILPTSVCATDVCERICANVEGCVTFNNQNGCSQVQFDQDLTVRTIVGLAVNPNIHSVLAVSLGCENCQNDMMISAIKEKTNKKVEGLIIQKVGGSVRAIEQGIKMAGELVEKAKLEKREKSGVENLIFGTNCGGSDTTSGLGSNPLIGKVSDWMIGQGATSVICETPEIFGGEHILARRAKTPEIGKKLLKIVSDYEKYVQGFGAEMREGNPSPGNMAGGITTLEEKSLGCIHKGGSSTLNAVYGYAEKIEPHAGLVMMDTPGNDASSVGGIIAGGCQLVVFSTGLGTPTGNAVAPVFRITANPNTAKTMADNTDMDCSESIFGPRTMIQLRDELISKIIDTCNGKLTYAEVYKFYATCLPHLCNYM